MPIDFNNYYKETKEHILNCENVKIIISKIDDQLSSEYYTFSKNKNKGMYFNYCGHYLSVINSRIVQDALKELYKDKNWKLEFEDEKNRFGDTIYKMYISPMVKENMQVKTWKNLDVEDRK